MKAKSRHDFDAMAPWYDPGMRLAFLPLGGEKKVRRRLMAPLFAGGAPKMILEIGCGTGANLAAMDKYLPPGCRWVGLDRSAGMLRQAAGKKLSMPSDLLRGDAAMLPFAGNAFDAAAVIFTLHELPGLIRIQAAEEIERILAPGGRLLVVEFSRPSGFWGRLLFRSLGLMEDETAMAFADGGVARLLSPLGFTLKETKTYLGGTVTSYLFTKKNGAYQK